MSYRARFEALIAELRARPEITVRRATLGPPTPAAEVARWRAVAGAAWPAGMTELYAEVAAVTVEYSLGKAWGAIHIPPVAEVWNYAALEDELWFDFCGPDHPFHAIRPIDRFVAEAYAVLYPVPCDREATVHYHYCGEALLPTGLTYRAWLDALFVARGAAYWLDLATGPRGRRTWVDAGHDAIAAVFPDFVPAALSPAHAHAAIAL